MKSIVLPNYGPYWRETFFDSHIDSKNWWKQMCKTSGCFSASKNVKDHGLTLAQIEEGLTEISPPRAFVEAFFTLKFGTDRLIADACPDFEHMTRQAYQAKREEVCLELGRLGGVKYYSSPLFLRAVELIGRGVVIHEMRRMAQLYHCKVVHGEEKKASDALETFNKFKEDYSIVYDHPLV